MFRLILGLLLISTTAFASDTLKLEVTTNDMTEVGVPYVDAQRFICQESETQKECYNRNKPEIDSEKTARIARYVDSVKNPSKPKEPTKTELEAQKQSLIDQKASIDAQVVELDSKIAVASDVVVDKDSSPITVDIG